MEEISDEKIIRNYDKEPIIIKDFNSLFLFLLQMALIPIMILVYIYNPGGTSDDSLFRNIFIIIPAMMYPYTRAYFKSRGKRKILLTNDSIKFMHESIVIEEISISEITDIKKTYSDIYHKSQNIKWFQLFGLFIILPIIAISQKAYYLLLVVPFFHICLIFVKYIFHKIKDNGYKYRFFDAVMVYSGERFINILPVTTEEYEVVRNYFLAKNLGDIQDKKIYFELMGHSFEKLK